MSDVIVVGTDGSETAGRAVDEAIRMAKLLEADVHLVTAYEPLRARVRGAPEGAAKVFQPLPDSHAQATVESAAAKARFGGVTMKTHTLQKAPADALLEVADEVGATLIVVGDRGMHGASRVLGSVPNTVSHRANCNVLIVSTGRPASGPPA